MSLNSCFQESAQFYTFYSLESFQWKEVMGFCLHVLSKINARPFSLWLIINLCRAKYYAQERGSDIIYLQNQQNQALCIDKSNLLKPERNP